MYIGVIGQKKCSKKVALMSYNVGRLIAERGGILLCGGLSGVMESAARGAREAGGTTIGILPGTERTDANPYISISIPTGLGVTRNFVLVTACDILIAITGGYGTLSEISCALLMGKKVIGLNTWGLISGEQATDHIVAADTPEDAVNKAFTYLKG